MGTVGPGVVVTEPLVGSVGVAEDVVDDAVDGTDVGG